MPVLLRRSMKYLLIGGWSVMACLATATLPVNLVKDLRVGLDEAEFSIQSIETIPFGGGIAFAIGNNPASVSNGTGAGTFEAGTYATNRLLGVSGTCLISATKPQELCIESFDQATGINRIVLQDPGFDYDPVFPPKTIAGLVYFTASDGGTTSPANDRLYRTDGTAEGTQNVLSLVSGLNGILSVRGIARAGSKIYLYARSSPGGFEWYRSNLTPNGTQLVTDLCPGEEDAGWTPFRSGSVGDVLVFPAKGTYSATTLFRTDGTEAGTFPLYAPPDANGVIVKSFYDISGRTLYHCRHEAVWELWSTDGTTGQTFSLGTVEDELDAAVFDGRLFYARIGIGNTIELWRTDGTIAGTAMFTSWTFAPGKPRVRPRLTVFNNRLYMSAWSDDTGWELFSTTGNDPASLNLATDHYKGGTSSYPSILSASPDGLFVLYPREGVSPTESWHQFGSELWRSNGTSEETSFVTRLHASGLLSGASSNPHNLKALGDRVAFQIWDFDVSRENPLEVIAFSDGTEPGTQVIAEAYPAVGIHREGKNLCKVDGCVVWEGAEAGRPDSIWRTDLTESGTFVLHEPGSGFDITAVASDGDVGYFGLLKSGSGQAEIWKTDGTIAGTVKAATINNVQSAPIEMAVINGRAWFQMGVTDGAEPWVCDGTGQGTFQLANVSLSGSASPRYFVGINGRVLFHTTEGLWGSDGTVAGTASLAASPGYTLMDYPSVAAGELGYFRASQPDGVWDLFATDGTPGSAHGVRNVSNGSAYVAPMGEFAGELLFRVQRPEDGHELWHSNGDPFGTDLIGEQYAGNNPAPLLGGNLDDELISFLPIGNSGRFIYPAPGPGSGVEIWSGDGTATGFDLLADVDPGPRSSYPHGFCRAGDKLFFVATTIENGTELFVSDSAFAGTTHLAPDPANGIHTIADAIAIAKPGDRIDILPGTYNEELVIDKSNLTLRGLSAVTIQVDVCGPAMSPIRMDEVTGVRLENLTLVSGLLDENANCGREEDRAAFGTPAGPCIQAGDSEFALIDCTLRDRGHFGALNAVQSQIEMTGCVLQGTDYKRYNSLGIGFSGSYAMDIYEVEVTATDCQFFGGNGVPDAQHGKGSIGPYGTNAIRATTSFVWLTDCIVKGGDGADGLGNQFGGFGLHGVLLTQEAFAFLSGQNTIQGGQGGEGGNGATDGQDGQPWRIESPLGEGVESPLIGCWPPRLAKLLGVTPMPAAQNAATLDGNSDGKVDVGDVVK